MNAYSEDELINKYRDLGIIHKIFEIIGGGDSPNNIILMENVALHPNKVVEVMKLFSKYNEDLPPPHAVLGHTDSFLKLRAFPDRLHGDSGEAAIKEEWLHRFGSHLDAKTEKFINELIMIAESSANSHAEHDPFGD